jgi:hypothetical protein
MKYKEEILKALEDLKEFNLARRQIEKELKYSDKYIDQQLSKGGNEKLLNGLKQLLEKKRLHKPTSVGSERNLHSPSETASEGPDTSKGFIEKQANIDALIEVVTIQSKSIHELSESVNQQTSVLKEQVEVLKSQQETIKGLTVK